MSFHGPRCKCCGANEGLQDHHINFRSKIAGSTNKERRDSQQNLITLCFKCHTRLHNKDLFICMRPGKIWFISRAILYSLQNWKIYQEQSEEIMRSLVQKN